MRAAVKCEQEGEALWKKREKQNGWKAGIASKMDRLFILCVALSFGIAFGGAAGILTKNIRKRHYTQQQIERGRKLWKIGSRIMTYVTCIFLVLGFIWCVYFLILGAVDPGRAEYANNMSELIAAVLTVVSIAFAFYEFIRRR